MLWGVWVHCHVFPPFLWRLITCGFLLVFLDNNFFSNLESTLLKEKLTQKEQIISFRSWLYWKGKQKKKVKLHLLAVNPFTLDCDCTGEPQQAKVILNISENRWYSTSLWSHEIQIQPLIFGLKIFQGPYVCTNSKDSNQTAMYEKTSLRTCCLHMCLSTIFVLLLKWQTQ